MQIASFFLSPQLRKARRHILSPRRASRGFLLEGGAFATQAPTGNAPAGSSDVAGGPPRWPRAEKPRPGTSLPAPSAESSASSRGVRVLASADLVQGAAAQVRGGSEALCAVGLARRLPRFRLGRQWGCHGNGTPPAESGASAPEAMGTRSTSGPGTLGRLLGASAAPQALRSPGAGSVHSGARPQASLCCGCVVRCCFSERDFSFQARRCRKRSEIPSQDRRGRWASRPCLRKAAVRD